MDEREVEGAVRVTTGQEEAEARVASMEETESAEATEAEAVSKAANEEEEESISSSSVDGTSGTCAKGWWESAPAPRGFEVALKATADMGGPRLPYRRA